jgi:MFS family permease
MLSKVNGEGSDTQQKPVRRSRPSAKRQLLVALQSSKPAAQSSSVNSWRGPACILGGALTHLTLGTLYCWGNFLSYAPAHLRYFSKSDGKGPPDALYVIPFTIIAQAIAMPWGPSLAKAVGAPRALMLGCWLAAAAVYMSSYQKDLRSFMLFYSFLFGTGAGLAYTSPMAAGWKWLPNHKGLVTGGVLASFGAGGFLFSMLGSKHVNPLGFNPVNGKFPPEVYERFPSMLRKLAVMYAVISFVGSCFVTEPAPVVAASAPATVTTSPMRFEGTDEHVHVDFNPFS